MMPLSSKNHHSHIPLI